MSSLKEPRPLPRKVGNVVVEGGWAGHGNGLSHKQIRCRDRIRPWGWERKDAECRAHGFPAAGTEELWRRRVHSLRGSSPGLCREDRRLSRTWERIHPVCSGRRMSPAFRHRRRKACLPEHSVNTLLFFPASNQARLKMLA